MAWIKTIGLHAPDLSPELMKSYQQICPMMPPEYALNGVQEVPGIIRAHSLDPVGLQKVFVAGLHMVNGPGPLSRREREMITTVVSATNHCFY